MAYVFLGFVLIILWIIYLNPKTNYIQEHRATPLGTKLKDDSNENETSGYSSIFTELAIAQNTRGDKIFPIEKREFLNHNKDAKYAYKCALVRAIAWERGWIPWNLRYKKQNDLDPFIYYNKKYKSCENEYYKLIGRNKLNRDDIFQMQKYELEKYPECYKIIGGINREFEYDISTLWDKDVLRYNI